MKTGFRLEARKRFGARFAYAVVGALAALLLATSVASAEMSSESDKYDSAEAAHPLRIVAYLGVKSP